MQKLLSPSLHPSTQSRMCRLLPLALPPSTAPAVFLVFVSLLLDLSCQIPASFRTDVAGGNLSAIAFLQQAPLLLHVLGHRGGGASLVDLSVIKGVHGSDGLVQNFYMRVTQKLAFSFQGVRMEMLLVQLELGAEKERLRHKGNGLASSCYLG